MASQVHPLLESFSFLSKQKQQDHHAVNPTQASTTAEQSIDLQYIDPHILTVALVSFILGYLFEDLLLTGCGMRLSSTYSLPET